MTEPATAAIRAELIAQEDDWARAIVSNDADRIGEFMAEDWVIISETGIGTREQFLGVVRSGDLTHSAFQVGGDVEVRSYADTAVVIKRVTNTAHFRGQQVNADEWTSDVFVRRDGRWRCTVSHITPVTVTG